MQFINILPLATIFMSSFVARASTSTTVTDNEASPTAPHHTDPSINPRVDDARSLVAPASLVVTRDSEGEEVNIQWFASSGPPTESCTPFDVSYRDDNCYPAIDDCQHIYDQYVNFSNGFCLDEPSGALDFSTLITWNTCQIQVSLLDNNFTCATAPDIADKIKTVLDSPYKSPDGKGVWTSFGNMKCPDGHYIGPVSWMEWLISCA